MNNITTRNRGLGQGNVFTPVSLFTGGFAYRGSVSRGKVGLPPGGGSASGGSPRKAFGMHPTGMLSCYRQQMKFAKVMFLHLSAILSTGRGLPGGVSRPRGVCPGDVQAQVKGVSAQGGQAQGDPGPGPGGVCICTEADTPTKRTATAADGTHPTGMHSCSISDRNFR